MRMRRFPKRSLAPAACLALALGLAAGCGEGDGLERQSVSGTVKFDGQPLDQGFIQFLPNADVKDPVMTGGPIEGGSYSIPAAEGPVPGTYKVSISSAGGEQAPLEDVMPGTGPKHALERIPTKYNTKTELTAEIVSGANTKDFDLSSQ